jgi:predicted LPLAT superfamily acyltransferase
VHERGDAASMRLLYAAYRRFGRRTFSLLLYPIVAYFLATSGKARRASSDYLRRVRAHLAALSRPLPRRLSTFWHFVEFGHSILDKSAMWAGTFEAGKVEFDDPQAMRGLLELNRGALFIASHLGNIEVLRALAEAESPLKVAALVSTNRSPELNRLLSAIGPRALERMIQIDMLGPESVIELQDKVRAGEHIGIAADRVSVRHAERSIEVPFLGEPAAFPEGPFVLASLLACPVYLLFCLRMGGRYRVYVEPFADPVILPRKERSAALEGMIARYANRLEAHCLLAPTQWFNFFEFWHQAGNHPAS